MKIKLENPEKEDKKKNGVSSKKSKEYKDKKIKEREEIQPSDVRREVLIFPEEQKGEGKHESDDEDLGEELGDLV
jgi:hypothetical protein